MGFESANYVYWPKRIPVIDWDSFLTINGAKHNPEASHFPEYILQGCDHWIDLQILPATNNIPLRISVRIALCNPDPAIDRLLKLLHSLLAKGGGTLVDQYSHKMIRSWTPSAVGSLRESFQQQQQSFSKFFGNKKAAVPADQVFRLLQGKTHLEKDDP